jgi:hypothetical protein
LSFYQTLFNLVVEHDYNSNGVCSNLKFYPTDRTSALFENTGLLFRNTLDGFQIVYDKARVEALQMAALDQQDSPSFDFKVFSTDPDFRSYTEPFSGKDEDILYFDNLAASGAGTQSLSTVEYVSASDFRKVEADELKDALQHRDHLLKPDFVVRLYLNNKKGSILEQWLEQTATGYLIKFANRRRYWKYYLLGRMVKQNETPAGFSIVDSDKQVEFESTGEEMMADRNRAYTFRSRQQIPLNEHYPFKFQLRQKGQAGEATIIPSLPFASVHQAGAESIAGIDEIVSEIYINS